MFATGIGRGGGFGGGGGPLANGSGARLNDRIAELDEELQSIDDDIKQLQKLRTSVMTQRNELRAQAMASGSASSSSLTINLANGRDGEQSTNYLERNFPWSGELLPRAQSIWKIRAFRSVQEAVCNAALDKRDVVCVMPTGGGKSLCYQLPAVMEPGLTLMISPLLSLSMDQMWHLREAGVTCEMLSSADSREEGNDILKRLRDGGRDNEIKVLFVTPERVAKSKTLIAALQKCYERDHLSRIVIDEAHCCSQMGHDFRPDYKKLAILRQLYPSVPILCLSATLAPAVLEDVRKILGLSRTVDPSRAPAEGTVYFTAPLHRPNLHYSVVSRSSAAKDSYSAIADWILANHQGQSGIVYTLSRADTQRMADALGELSKGKIRSAVYHAELEDYQKKQIHHKWRSGDVHVVVATIAFGMGIDKGDVRFVVHASLGKSLDSYYQESGRAGRDGGDADCVLFYRPADAARVSGMLASDHNGHAKLHPMLEYAQSTECRKSIFGRYFQDRYGDGSPCGACDNCRDKPSTTDVTYEAWKLLRVIDEVFNEGGRVTLAGLGDLARGLGGGQYTVIEATQSKRKRGKRNAKGPKQSGFLKIADTIGEKVKLSKDDTERVLIELLLKDYLADKMIATTYAVNVYSKPGRNAPRLTRFSAEAVQARQAGCPRIEVCLEAKSKKTTSETPAKTGAAAGGMRKKAKTSGAKKSRARELDEDLIEDEESNDEGPLFRSASAAETSTAGIATLQRKPSFVEEEYEDGSSMSLQSAARSKPPVSQRKQQYGGGSSGGGGRYPTSSAGAQDEPIELDSD